jgi:hypothetical protein
VSKKLCAIAGCTFPEGECRELCWHPEERRMDIIGQNGNTGEHYPQAGSVRVTVIQDGKVDLEYIASWSGDRKDVLDRATKLIQMLIKEDA